MKQWCNMFVDLFLELVVISPFLAGRSKPGAGTINSLCEDRHVSACGSPSDRLKNVWVSQTEAATENSFSQHFYFFPPSPTPHPSLPPAIKRFLTVKHWGQSYLNNFGDRRRACSSHGKKNPLWKKTAMLDNSASAQPGAMVAFCWLSI